MKVLSRDQILTTKDLRKEWFPTPEWGNGDPEAGVYVREMSDKERSRFEQTVLKNMNGPNAQNMNSNLVIDLRPRLVSMCLVDEDGNEIFTSEDVKALAEKSAAILVKITDVIFRLSGFNEDEKKQIEGNLKAQNDDSSID